MCVGIGHSDSVPYTDSVHTNLIPWGVFKDLCMRACLLVGKMFCVIIPGSQHT